jgi:hypothetical protein
MLTEVRARVGHAFRPITLRVFAFRDDYLQATTDGTLCDRLDKVLINIKLTTGEIAFDFFLGGGSRKKLVEAGVFARLVWLVEDF